MGVERRRRSARIAPIRAIFVAVGIFLGLCVLAGAWIIRAPLPKLDGTVDAPGLGAQAQILRDDRGIPHIRAASASDAFYAQGFACAQDRLWQMDLLRREAEGTLSEVLGSATVSVDEYFRTLGLAHVADRVIARADPSERDLLIAYAAGVNAAAATRALPLEFRLLGYEPARWTPQDSIAVGLLITRDQDDNWKDIMLRADLGAKIGAAGARALTDNQIPALEEFMPGYGPTPRSTAPSSASSDTAPGVAVAADTGSRSVQPPDRWDHQGSNNWAVAPPLTTTGKPVLSNDTHLDHTLPSTWWVSQIEGGGFDVEGFTLPGVPGVIIGHNDRIAWGVTSAAEDVEDIFVERFESKTSDRYLHDGRWIAAVHRKERIAVKGSAPVDYDVLVTRHGPLVKRSGVTGYALAWTVLNEGVDLRAVMDFDRAHDWNAFRSALAEFVGPTLNFAYADVDGHIGYQDAGRVPARAAGDGSVPVEGQDDRFAWKGDVPFATLPHALDPPRGFLASANNEVVPPGFAPSLSRDYLSPYRIHEITKLLSEPGRRPPEAIGAIQADDYDYARARLAAVAAPMLLASPSETDRDLGRILQTWDGHAATDATAPTFAAALEAALQQQLLGRKLGADLLARYGKEHHLITPIVRTMDGDRSLLAAGITPAMIRDAILPAAHDAESALDYPKTPLRRWGATNAAIYAHPLGVAWPLTLLNAPTVEQPGDVFTVFQSRPDFGPSMRFVADLDDWDDSSMLLTLGESGIWTDAHYQDMEDDWLHVAWRPTPFTDGAVDRAAVDMLHLEPPAH